MILCKHMNSFVTFCYKNYRYNVLDSGNSELEQDWEELYDEEMKQNLVQPEFKTTLFHHQPTTNNVKEATALMRSIIDG